MPGGESNTKYKLSESNMKKALDIFFNCRVPAVKFRDKFHRKLQEQKCLISLMLYIRYSRPSLQKRYTLHCFFF